MCKNTTLIFSLLLSMTVYVTSSVAQQNTQNKAEAYLTFYTKSVSDQLVDVSFESTQNVELSGDWNYDIFPRQLTIKTKQVWNLNAMDIQVETVEGSTSVQARSPGFRKERLIFANKGNFANEFVSYNAFNNEKPRTVFIDSEKNEYNNRAHKLVLLQSEMFLYDFALGHLTTTKISDIMRIGNLHLLDEMEIIDGHPTYVLKSKSEYGEYDLWLDPESRFNPRRILMEQKGNDTFYGVPLNTPPHHEAGEVLQEPDSPLIHRILTVDSIKIIKIDQIYFITNAIITETKLYQNKKSLKSVTQINRNNIVLQPNIEKIGAFQLDAPDGAAVAFYSKDPEYRDPRQGVSYEWSHGNIKAVVDKGDLKAMTENVNSIRNGNTNIDIVITTKTTDQQYTKGHISANGEAVPKEETVAGYWNGIILLSLLLCLISIAGFGYSIRSRRKI